MNVSDAMKLARARRLTRAAEARARQLAAAGDARAIRLRAGLTLEDVGELLDVSAAAVSRWETNSRVPRGQLAVNYVGVLDALEREVPAA